MKAKSKKKKPTVEDLVKLAHASGLRVNIELVAKPPPYTKAVCMVCHAPIPVVKEFNRQTGLGICKRKKCRGVFAEAGIV